jgi:serine/threonine-protein kinase
MKRCPSCHSNLPSDYTHCPRDGNPLLSVAEWTEGSLVRGKYRILAKVGEGGMASVYKAMHTRFNELRALKVISPELAGDANFVRRFEQEAIVTRKLQHPNAVRVDDIDEAEDGRPFIVMEYVEGRSLKEVIEQEAPMTLPRVSAIVQQTAAALNAAHAVGLVHRDIKPGNIALAWLTDASGVRGEMVKVLDFGIAKLKEVRLDTKTRSVHLSLTDTGMMIGTPAYMSPEQAKGVKGDQLDGRSDIYSLGVVMYQMLSADLPLKADSTLEQLMAHLNTPPRPIREVRPDIPPEFAAVVMRCLEKNRDLRPANGADLMSELQLASSRPVATEISTAPPPLRKQTEVKPEPETTAPLVLEKRPQISEGTTQDALPGQQPDQSIQSRRLLWGAIAVLLLAGLTSFEYMRLHSRPPKPMSNAGPALTTSASPKPAVNVPANPLTELPSPSQPPQTAAVQNPAAQLPNPRTPLPAAKDKGTQAAGFHDAPRVHVDPGVEAGHLIHQVAPIYPPLAKQARVQGVVTLQARIGKDGNIENLQVMSGHPLLASAAIDAVKQWKYEPYLLNGQSVTVETTIQVNFTLGVEPQRATAAAPTSTVPSQPSAAAALLSTPTGAASIYFVGNGVLPPTIISAPQPSYTDEASRARKEGKVVLSAVIDTTGHAQNLRVVTALGYGLDEKAIEAVKRWRFQPGTKDGKPVNVQLNIEVEFRQY